MAKNNLKLAIVCKTYKGDVKPFKKLFKTLISHNADNIPVLVSVPKSDVPMFLDIVGGQATILTDESYAGDYFTKKSHWGLPLGYINQEICKLSFWETKIAENYLFVDSDAYFIRDFKRSDFMADANTPYSVLVMDKDLNSEVYYKDYGTHRLKMISKIFEAVGLDDRRYLTCHGMTVMNTKVLSDFKKNFMEKRKYSYDKLIEISPFEYTWYNSWLQKSNVIPVIGVEPFFKTFHMRIEYAMCRLRLVTESDLASQYVGIILNSNWQPTGPPDKYVNPGEFQKIFNKIITRF